MPELSFQYRWISKKQMETVVLKCDPLCAHITHPFIYLLNKCELACFQFIGEEIFENDKPLEASKIIVDVAHQKEDSPLHQLYQQLVQFFSLNPQKSYFLKLSSISPKDAYDNFHGLSAEDENEDDYEIIKRNIWFLKVGLRVYSTAEFSARSCIQILCHSNRVFLDVIFEQEKKPLYVLLLDWFEPNLKTETRCLVSNRKVFAITQYFVDFSDCYVNLGDIEVIYGRILQFLEKSLQSIPLPNVSMDLDVSADEIRLIEYNGLDESDKCLFEKEEIPTLIQLSESADYVPPFRYITEGSMKQLH